MDAGIQKAKEVRGRGAIRWGRWRDDVGLATGRVAFDWDRRDHGHHLVTPPRYITSLHHLVTPPRYTTLLHHLVTPFLNTILVNHIEN